MENNQYALLSIFNKNPQKSNGVQYVINQYSPNDDCKMFNEFIYDNQIKVNRTLRELSVNFTLPKNIKSDTNYTYYINIYKNSDISNLENVDSLYCNNSKIWIQKVVTKLDDNYVTIELPESYFDIYVQVIGILKDEEHGTKIISYLSKEPLVIAFKTIMLWVVYFLFIALTVCGLVGTVFISKKKRNSEGDIDLPDEKELMSVHSNSMDSSVYPA